MGWIKVTVITAADPAPVKGQKYRRVIGDTKKCKMGGGKDVVGKVSVS